MATYLFAHINWSSAGAFALFYFLRSNTKTVPSEAEAPTWKFVKGNEFQNGKTFVMSHSFYELKRGFMVFFLQLSQIRNVWWKLKWSMTTGYSL